MPKKPQIDLMKIDITSILDVVSSVQSALVKSGKSYHATVFLQQALASDNGSEVVKIANKFVDLSYSSFDTSKMNNMFDVLTDYDDDDDDDDDDKAL